MPFMRILLAIKVISEEQMYRECKSSTINTSSLVRKSNRSKKNQAAICSFVESHISLQNYFGRIARFGEDIFKHGEDFDLKICAKFH